MDNEDRRVVYQTSADAPNNPQKTNFMMVEYPAGIGDEMCVPKGMSAEKSSGEEAVLKYRTPY